MTKKSEIEALVASELPDQNKREITPPRLRAVFLGFVNRAVLQDQDFPAGNLTGTLADAQLPTSQAGKTFTSPVQHASGTASLPGVTFAGDTDTGMFRPGANTLAWATGGVERGRITGSGNVGIGATDPIYRLQVLSGATQPIVAESTTTNAFIAFKDATTSNLFSVRLGATGNALTFQTSTTERMRIDSAGNVGIGTSSPSDRLDVRGTVLWGSAAQGRLTNSGADIFVDSVGTAGNIILRNNPTGAGTTERMRIDSSGNVGIGTSAPSTKLHVDGTVRFQNLPTTDPGVSGALWNDAGTLKISA